MKTFKDVREACWKGYRMLGTKKKAGKQVPNCIPEEYKRPTVYPDGKAIPTALPALYQPAKNAGVPKGQNCANCEYYVEESRKCTKWNNAVVRPLYWCAKWEAEEHDIEEAAPAWTRKEGKNPTGGLNAKGIASYRRANPGSKLSMAVTTPPSKLDPDGKAAGRRKSFCARMGGSKGPMKDEKGDPTRKALALRKWNC